MHRFMRYRAEKRTDRQKNGGKKLKTLPYPRECRHVGNTPTFHRLRRVATIGSTAWSRRSRNVAVAICRVTVCHLTVVRCNVGGWVQDHTAGTGGEWLHRGRVDFANPQNLQRTNRVTQQPALTNSPTALTFRPTANGASRKHKHLSITDYVFVRH